MGYLFILNIKYYKNINKNLEYYCNYTLKCGYKILNENK